MAKDLVGLVYYEDDPEKRIFRVVYPTVNNAELDEPEHVTVGIDPTRRAVMRKVLASSEAAKAPFTGSV